jgi:alpha-N-arabinofuranosidase
MKKCLFPLLIAFLIYTGTQAQVKNTIVVKADNPLYAIQPTMWGVFFEDINFAADGGIYAELVKNRSFEFFQPLWGW